MSERSVYKRAREGTITREIEEEILFRFGDGRPFRWKDVRDAYKRAWKKIKGRGEKEINFEPTLGVSRFMERTGWIVSHQDTRPRYLDDGRGPFFRKGIWNTVVSEEQIRRCQVERKNIPPADDIRRWDAEHCAACRKAHPGPYKPRPIGRYEVI